MGTFSTRSRNISDTNRHIFNIMGTLVIFLGTLAMSHLWQFWAHS